MNSSLPSHHALRLLLLVVCKLLVFAICTSAPAHAEATAQEMIDALATKNSPDTAGLRTRTRGIAAKSQVPFSGQLQLSVQFEFASATISVESRQLLTTLGSAMSSTVLAQKRFRIEGHTDAVGDPQVNQRLSERRAQSVRQFLIEKANVQADRLIAVGKGSSEPTDLANPAASINRRVVVVALDNSTVTSDATPTKGDAGTPAVTVAETVSAGIVQKIQGDVSVVRADTSVTLSGGDTVQEGDTISARSASSALVQLADGAKLLVRPNTEVKLTRIINVGAMEKLTHSIALAFGAIRYVTGAVGKSRPQSVRFSTPTATIGIRGTDIEIVYAAKTRSVQGSGAYVRVNSGEIEFDGVDGSKVALVKNEQAFASTPGPKTRGKSPSPAARKLDAPAGVFSTGELDSLLDAR